MEKTKLKLPYGISNFAEIVTDNYHYIDRTNYIETLEGLGEKYILFIRPRRFGKSLFVSVLDYYYNILHSDKFEKFFGNLYIGKKPTAKKNSYLILKFNFSGIRTETKENAEKGFLKKIKVAVDFFLINYNHLLKISEKKINEILSETLAESLLDNFLKAVKLKTDKKIYVLIDEYDHFANEFLSFNTTIFQEITTETGFVRKFYESLKEGTETLIERIFITGVSPITLDSLTSGFNITMNLSVDEGFNEMLGFTKNEVLFLINETIKDCPNLETDDIFNDLKELYDGYLFHEDAITNMFNSDMVLYYLSKLNNCKKPKKLLDKNFASDYSKIKNMFKIMDSKESYDVLKEIVFKETVTGKIVDEFSIVSFGRNELLSLLYYTGILTICGSELADIIFKIPNYVIKELYYEYFIETLTNQINYELETEKISFAIRKMALNSDIVPFIRVAENLLKELSNRDFIKFDEKYIKAVLITYLTLSQAYYIRSEPEYDKKYFDILCIGKDIYNIKHHWLIELKYLKKDSSSTEFENKKSEALKQIENYNVKENVQGVMHKTVMVWVSDKCSFLSVDGKEIVLD
jgi:hypothetical protein